MSKFFYFISLYNSFHYVVLGSSKQHTKGMVLVNRISVVTIKMEKEKNILVDNKKVSSPKDVYELMKDYLKGADREYLVLLSLDMKNNINSINTVSIRSLNSSIVHPREIFKTAILSNAASIILIHNHPSGDTTPSKEDINITYRIKESGKILGIELLDHVILGDNSYSSLKEKSIL